MDASKAQGHHLGQLVAQILELLKGQAALDAIATLLTAVAALSESNELNNTTAEYMRGYADEIERSAVYGGRLLRA